MGHCITALLLQSRFDPLVADRWDLRPVALAELTMFHLNHTFSAYWQRLCGHTDYLEVPQHFPSVFPREGVIARMVAELTGAPTPLFALIMTEYFGGIGEQWACTFLGSRRRSKSDASINGSLADLGIVRTDGKDEFDTVGLGEHRSNPEYLDHYAELCEELGV